MRVALVSQEYPPETAHGGIGSQTQLKATGLAARGHEVVVVAHGEAEFVRHQHDGDVRVVRIPASDPRMEVRTEASRWIVYSTEVAATLAALHAEAPLDLVDVPEYGGEGYVHLLNQSEGYGAIPTVVQLHGPLVMLAATLGWPAPDSDLYQLGTLMEATSLRLADGVYSSSRLTAHWCEEHYGLHGEVPILHLGVDTKRFAPRQVPRDERPTVVFVGRLHPAKGIGVLAEAAINIARAGHRDLRLRLIGAGEPELLQGLRARAVRAGYPQLIELPGPAARDNLPSELARADVFAAPSYYEGGPGLVYLEAMACGLPVIACSGSGVEEVVRPGVTGLVVPPRDVDAVAAALDLLLSDHQLRFEMGRRARHYTVTEADSMTAVLRLEELYLDVLSSTTRSGPCAGFSC